MRRSMLSPVSVDFAWPRHSLSPAEMADVFEDFDRIVDTFLRPQYTNTVNFQPSCDVNETKNHYLVSFDMPGVKKEDIKVEVRGNELVISGERQRELTGQQGEARLQVERSYGRFERTFTLPTTIAADKIEAHYENGVLNVALPKAEAAKGRTIQIQTGQGSLLSKLLGSKREANKELKDVTVS